MRTCFLITARLKSTRLPRKALLDLAGKPVIVHMLDRLKTARRIMDLVICTSTNPQDDPLAELARQEGILVFRGSEDDVLDRLSQAAVESKADYVLNVTADCPLVDPGYADKTVDCYRETNADLITACQLPHGAYCWGIKVEALRKVCEIKAETDTEVWADYFTKSGLFTVHDLEIEPELCRPELRLTLDYPEDLELLQRLFAALYIPGRLMPLRDIVRWLDTHPEVLAINRHCATLYQMHRTHSAPMKLKPTATTQDWVS